MESLRVAQEVSSGLGCGGLASKVVSKSGCVSVSSAACVSGAGYHCGSGLKLQSSSSQVKANGASKLGSALWGSSVVLSSASDEVKVAQRSVSARASVEAPDAPAKTSIVRSADTAGAVLVLEDVTLSAGGRDLLTGATWRLLPGQRTGLVGVNGCGKSTLLRSLVGRGDFNGYVAMSLDTELAYLEQTAVSGSTRTVWDEARSRMVAINDALEEMEAAEKAVERGEEGAIARLASAQEQVEATDGYRVDEMIAGVLNGLGFQQEDWTRSCSDFSGGWQMRIALARLLLEQRSHMGKSLLLLDEPTNHLDTKAKEWLGRYLTGVTAAVILVSHEQEFVEKSCNHIAEITGGQLNHYVGNYSSFLRARAARQLQAVQAYKAKQAEIERLQVFVDRFGAKATKASAANSRKKMIEKIKQEMPDEAPPEDSGPGTGDRRTVKMYFPKAPPCQREALRMKKVEIGWDESAPMLHNVDIKLEIGMRLVILGPNGAGKSTLMRAMAGRGGVLSGSREVGDGVEIGVFTQDLAQDLPGHLSALNFVLQEAREKDISITDEMARSALGALGLTGEAALRPISALSGGEKARAALGVFMLRPYNCLMLDEASNHLDRPSAMALAKCLSQFTGAMVAISHDIEFCEAMNPTHIARVDPNGTVTVSLCINGDLRTPLKASKPQAATPATKGKKQTASTSVKPAKSYGGSTHAKPVAAPDPKRVHMIQSQIKKNMQLIEKAEIVLEMLDREMLEAGPDAGKAMDIFKRKEAIEKRKAALEREWENLENENQKLLAKSAK
ncbi:hypothetical protein M758_6G009100 [Ceratodon purpureus]|nr:hypothetical protein M758_6G009100 [Ceratodon purpureus]